MQKLKAAVMSTDHEHNLLDHLAPLAFILDVPLYVRGKKNFELTKKLYPHINCIYYEDFSFEFFAKNFDILIACKFWQPPLNVIFENFYNKKMKLVFCPHGNSDKGHIEPASMLSFGLQNSVFLYGNNIKDRLKNLKVLDKVPYATIGNYRYQYYIEHKVFYDSLIQKEILSKLNPKNKTILYAPTWKDPENLSTFFVLYEKLISQLPSHYNLIIKPHPAIEDKNPELYYSTIKDNHSSNILVLNEFPLIYPLLNISDIYLGDFSSIGYDFLQFQRPMFFFDLENRKPDKKSLFLHNCGIQIPSNDYGNIFSYLDQSFPEKFKKIQKDTFDYTYDNLSINDIKDNIYSILLQSPKEA